MTAVAVELHEVTAEIAALDRRLQDASQSSQVEELREEIEELRASKKDLERQVLVLKAKAGELNPPQTIETSQDAEEWLAWARVNFHHEGCSCHRCPIARSIQADPDQLFAVCKTTDGGDS